MFKLGNRSVCADILETIGNTPLISLSRLSPPSGAKILAKMEAFNPMSSVKDRIALSMIVDAERSGILASGMTVVEPTSGNTGIGLAMVCAVKGYRLILVMPDTMSIERQKLLKAFGAELILTDGTKGMKGAIEAAEKILTERDNIFMPQQFRNPANPKIHRETTAEEIISEAPSIDAFVAGVGTGGTITGVGEVLKRHNPNTLIVAVEPENSAVISGEEPGSHRIQGIGAGFLPEVLNLDVVDRVIKVRDSDAISTTRRLAETEGILAGISSGAAMWAALQVALELKEDEKVIVILPDSGERYLSTDLFASKD